MAIADKLTYLNATKLLLRDAIRRAGHYLPDAATFRSYPYAMLPDEASLSLDFVRGEYVAHNWRDGTASRAGLSNIMTTTRASGGGYFDHLGVYQWAANDTPRIDHDPATVSSSTSSVTMASGAVTLAVTVTYPVGSYVRATHDGSNWMAGRVTASTGSSVTLWVDRVVGSGTYASWTVIRGRGLLVEESRTNRLLNSATLATQTVTVTAVAHTLTFYGTGSVTLSGAATGTLTGTGAGNRVSLTFTPAAGSLTLTVSGTVTSAQLEGGAFPTSHIPTTTAQVTRAADQCVVSNLADWYRASEGTLVFNGNTLNTGVRVMTTLSDGGISNRLQLIATPTARGAAVVSGGSVQCDLGAGGNAKAAFAFAENNFRLVVGGGSPSFDTSGSVPSVSQMRVGSYPNNSTYLNGHIESIQYIPRALSNTELQEITS